MRTSINICLKDGEGSSITARGWRSLLLLAGMGFTLFFGMVHTAQAAGFNAVGSMGSARQLHTATLLDTGGVLITGGFNSAASPATLAGAELYNAATGTFSPAGNMTVARRLHSATKLSNGTVLIVGGIGSDGTVLNSAEIYTPATGTFSPTTGSMADERQAHTATLLNNGTVLITGGRSTNSSSSALSSAVIYNPTTGLFIATTGPMNQSRAYHTATRLGDGKVLITGGLTYNGSTTVSTNTAEIYDPVTGLFTATSSMTSARNYHAAVLLNDGTVLITGGSIGSAVPSLDTAEIFNPLTGGFSNTTLTLMGAPHSRHTATLLTDGTVLIAGSQNVAGTSVSYSQVAELFLWDGESGMWFFSPDYEMTSARANHTATRLLNGMVLLAGGQTDSANVTATAELFSYASAIPGDCNSSGTVTIDEVQSAINMFLGINPVLLCVDTSKDGVVTIDEVQKAINGFLGL